MSPTKTDTLRVPGAVLHYELRGSGPVLLMICGGLMDAAVYEALAARLADAYTVVTYDRRGNSRSPLDGPPEEQRIEVHADDASRLLAAVGGGPAYVFGNSSGAVIGLDLAVRHPERVRALVAHEPVVFELLPDRDYWRALVEEVHETFADHGAGAAMQRLSEGLGMSDGGAEPPPEMLTAMARIMGNLETFVGYETRSFSRYIPDVDALRTGSPRVVVAAGTDSAGEPAHRAAVALATRLGTVPVAFPGDHGGFNSRAEEFAGTLRATL